MLRFPIIERYVTREIFLIFTAIVAILVLVLMGGSLVRLLQLAAGGDIGKDAVFSLLGLEILRMTGRLVPPAFFFATLFVLGRMYRDNEMTVLASSGISVTRILRLVLVLAVPVSLATAWLTVVLYPSITFLTTRIKMEQQDAVIVAAMDAGRFVESNRGDIVVYSESRGDEPGHLKKVFVQQRDKDTLSIVTAIDARHHKDKESGQRMLTLNDGIRFERVHGQAPSYSLLTFGEYAMWINPSNTDRLRKRYTVWSSAALLEDGGLEASAELQSRLAYPLSLLAFVLLAVPLSRSLPRQNVHGRIVVAIVVYLVFTGLNEVASTWMVKGVTPPWLGTWWVIGLMVVMGTVLTVRDLQPAWLRRRSPRA